MVIDLVDAKEGDSVVLRNFCILSRIKKGNDYNE